MSRAKHHNRILRPVFYLLAVFVLSTNFAMGQEISVPKLNPAVVEEVRRNLGATLKLQETISYRFVWEINRGRQVIDWTRDGGRFKVITGVPRQDGRIVGIIAVAWNGKFGSHRPSPRVVEWARDRERFRVGVALPEQCLMPSLLAWLTPNHPGLVRESSSDLEILEAESIDVDGRRLIRMKIRDSETTDEYLLDPKTGYLPQERKFSTTSGANGKLLRVGYTQVFDAGNPIWIATSVELGTSSNHLKCEVDVRSLRVNPIVNESTFTLQPWPNEQFLDNVAGDGKVTQPTDVHWIPDESVGYPWTKNLETLRSAAIKRREAAASVASVSARPAIADAMTAKPASRVKDGQSDGASNNDPARESTWNFTQSLVALILVVVGAVVLRSVRR